MFETIGYGSAMFRCQNITVSPGEHCRATLSIAREAQKCRGD